MDIKGCELARVLWFPDIREIYQYQCNTPFIAINILSFSVVSSLKTGNFITLNNEAVQMHDKFWHKAIDPRSQCRIGNFQGYRWIKACKLSSKLADIDDINMLSPQIISHIFNSFPASGDFCQLLITFANSLDPDPAQQNVGPDLDPNCLMAFLKDFFEKVNLKKIPQKIKNHAILPSMQRINHSMFIAMCNT